MQLGFECRQKHIKQVPLKATERTAPICQERLTPGPNHYEPLKICGGDGYSKIRRAPAYTFGRVLKPNFSLAVQPNAPMFDVRDISEKGYHKIPGGLITPYIDPPGSKMKVPGPGAYDPQTKLRTKRVPAYSMRPAAKPPYQPFDAWTPPPNMYCPPIPKPNAPSYTFGYPDRTLTQARLPGPGEHNPNFNFVQKTKPAYSFGPRYTTEKTEITPPPNIYCEKKFMVGKRSIPAPSFGIRHSPFLGKSGVFLKPSDIDLKISKI